jgi:hypothetical protein
MTRPGGTSTLEFGTCVRHPLTLRPTKMFLDKFDEAFDIVSRINAGDKERLAAREVEFPLLHPYSSVEVHVIQLEGF